MEGTVGQSIQVMNQDLVHLNRFDGDNFTRWQEKVLFFLTTLKLAYILGDDNEEIKEKRRKRKEDDFLCRGHILNALSSAVYSAHRLITTSKELWTALDNKYRIEEASNRKFLISNYMDFKITDDQSVMAQVQKLQQIVGDLKIAGITLMEEFKVGVIIAKLPLTWNNYKKKLKHDEHEHTLESLQRHLRIEEDSRIRYKKEELQEDYSKANMVEDHKSNPHLKPKNNEKFKKQNSNSKKKGNCYFCNKPGHYVREIEIERRCEHD